VPIYELPSIFVVRFRENTKISFAMDVSSAEFRTEYKAEAVSSMPCRPIANSMTVTVRGEQHIYHTVFHYAVSTILAKCQYFYEGRDNVCCRSQDTSSSRFRFSYNLRMFATGISCLMLLELRRCQWKGKDDLVSLTYNVFRVSKKPGSFLNDPRVSVRSFVFLHMNMDITETD
jgi:hypothetical protein